MTISTRTKNLCSDDRIGEVVYQAKAICLDGAEQEHRDIEKFKKLKETINMSVCLKAKGYYSVSSIFRMYCFKTYRRKVELYREKQERYLRRNKR